MNTERSCDLSRRGSFLQEPSGELQLLIGHLLRPPEADTTLPSVDAAGSGALADEVALEFCDAREDSHNHLTGVRGGVGPGFGKGLEASTGLAYRFDDLQQITGGTAVSGLASTPAYLSTRRVSGRNRSEPSSCSATIN
jgi:hypothetical protein